jgi:hypothetical protein
METQIPIFVLEAIQIRPCAAIEFERRIPCFSRLIVADDLDLGIERADNFLPCRPFDGLIVSQCNYSLALLGHIQLRALNEKQTLCYGPERINRLHNLPLF